jgi:hypothetical protein
MTVGIGLQHGAHGSACGKLTADDSEIVSQGIGSNLRPGRFVQILHFRKFSGNIEYSSSATLRY